jgi:hypothetical protein
MDRVRHVRHVVHGRIARGDVIRHDQVLIAKLLQALNELAKRPNVGPNVSIWKSSADLHNSHLLAAAS